ncbi:YhdP family protein [Pseudoalteromonas xiamenensis]
MKFRTISFYLLRKVWQLFAVTLVLLAVVVSALKYSLPYANDYKQDIETLLFDEFGVDIAIGSISASWQGNGPALVLEGLSFADNQTSPIALDIENTSLHINLVESVKTWQLKSNYFVLSGLSANIDASRFNSGNGEFEQQSLLESLFLGETGHFEVKDSQLQIKLPDGKKRTLLVDSLLWQNQPEQHRGYGKIAIPGISEGEFTANLALHGRTFGEVAGDIYFSAQGVDAATWLGPWLDKNKQQVSTDLNATAWLSVNSGRFSTALMQWQPSYIHWQQDNIAQELSLEAGEAQVFFDQNQGWDVAASAWHFSHGGRDYPAIEWQASQKQGKLDIWLKSLSLSLVSELLDFSNQESIKNTLAFQPQGMVSAAKIEWQDKTNWQAYGSVEELGWQNRDGVPGAQALSAEIFAVPERIRLAVNGENNHLLTGNVFSKAMAYEQLHAVIEARQSSEGWSLQSNDIWFANNELNLAAEWRMDLFGEQLFSLYAELTGGDGKNASQYFPIPVMDANLIAYLKGAIKSGQHQRSQILLNGNLSDFPFSDNSGQFEVKSELNQVEFAFAPDWFAITNAQVELDFTDEKMTILAKDGQLLNQTIHQPVTVYINDLMHADHLYVDIKTTTESSTLPRFFSQTPLAKHLDPVFEVIKPQGNVSGDVLLTVDLRSSHVNAVGNVDFLSNTLEITQPGMSLTNVSGRLDFSDENLSISELSGLWRTMPIVVSLDAQTKQQDYVVAIQSGLSANHEELDQVTSGLTQKFVTGETEIKTDITLNFSPTGFHYTAKATSDLKGMAISLPEPYTKRSDQTQALSVSIQGDDISNLITAQLNNQLYFNGILDNATGKISNANIVVGNKNQGLSDEGLVVSVNQPSLQLEPWFPFLKRLIDVSSKPSEQGILPSLTRVNGDFNQLDIGPLPFSEAQFVLKPDPDGYGATITAKELRAKATLPPSGSSRPIGVLIDYLRLLPKENTTEQQDTVENLEWLTHIPAVEAQCLDCKIKGYQLDKVSLSLFGDGKNLMIPELVVDKKEHVLRGEAKWSQGVSEFKGKLESKDVGSLFDEFDITTTVKDSTADVNFALNWQGAPYHVDLNSLGGEVKWRLGEGHLTEVSDGGARVFSLLSLDSLVRKLKLDFRDVFSKGFFYNQITGSMQIKSGIAYTQDTKMDGVPADLTIKGYANLATREIEYDLSVAPQVTSSLPVIVAWMVNPVSGLAALALDKVVHSARVISEIKFKVSGTMDEPHVTEIDRKSREVELPQAAQSQPPEEQNDSAIEQQQDAMDMSEQTQGISL